MSLYDECSVCHKVLGDNANSCKTQTHKRTVFSAPFFNFVFFNTNPNICTSDLDHSCKFYFTKTQTHKSYTVMFLCVCVFVRISVVTH